MDVLFRNSVINVSVIILDTNITVVMVMDTKSIEGRYYSVKLSKTTKQEDKDLGQNLFNTTNVAQPVHEVIDRSCMYDGIRFQPKIHLGNKCIIVINNKLIRIEECDIIVITEAVTNSW